MIYQHVPIQNFKMTAKDRHGEKTFIFKQNLVLLSASAYFGLQRKQKIFCIQCFVLYLIKIFNEYSLRPVF